MCINLVGLKFRKKLYVRSKMASHKRYFLNAVLRVPNAQLKKAVDAQEWKKRIIQLAKYIQTNEDHFMKDVDGGLYVGPAGIAYAFYYIAITPELSIAEEDKNQFLQLAMKLVETNIRYYEKADVIRDKRNQLGFLTGSAGVYAVAAAIALATKSEAQLESHLNQFSSLSQHFIPVKIHRGGSDEMFVGRAGYICAALWLKGIDSRLDVIPIDTMYKICDAMITSGREYSRSRGNNAQQPPPPLMYAYYKTEYLGAAHGLCAILQMMISVPGYLQQSSQDVVNDIKTSIDYILSIQTPEGNIPCAMDEAPPYGQRSVEEDLVHWCHGAPGVVYLFAKAYLVWNDPKYLDAAIRCGDCVWEKGLLKKGPGICHGVAGSGYVFLLLYRMTNDEKYLGRASHFSEFMYTEEFNKGSRQPDCPFSLYEGLAGTLCYLTDLLQPNKSIFPFFNVF